MLSAQSEAARSRIPTLTVRRAKLAGCTTAATGRRPSSTRSRPPAQPPATLRRRPRARELTRHQTRRPHALAPCCYIAPLEPSPHRLPVTTRGGTRAQTTPPTRPLRVCRCAHWCNTATCHESECAGCYQMCDTRYHDLLPTGCEFWCNSWTVRLPVCLRLRTLRLVHLDHVPH